MDTPLELPLETALHGVGYTLGPRVYADQIIAQAMQDDRVPGAISTEDIQLMQMPRTRPLPDPMRMTETKLEGTLTEASTRIDALILSMQMTEYQQMVVDERVPAFLRVAENNRWRVEYRANPLNYWRHGEALPAREQELRSESVWLRYGDEHVAFLIGGKETQGLIETEFDHGGRKMLRTVCRETGADYQLWCEVLGVLNGKPFEPQPIANLVAELVGGRP